MQQRDFLRHELLVSSLTQEKELLQSISIGIDELEETWDPA
jgi:hypothetical protein